MSSLSSADRFSYFVRKVTDFEVVWGLRNDAGWVMASLDADETFPVWPEQAFAQACAVGHWKDCHVEAMPLEHFIHAWLPELEKGGQRVAVFPLNDGAGSICTPAVLLAELEAELAQYE